jgi:hypothetical protein
MSRRRLIGDIVGVKDAKYKDQKGEIGASQETKEGINYFVRFIINGEYESIKVASNELVDV